MFWSIIEKCLWACNCLLFLEMSMLTSVLLQVYKDDAVWVKQAFSLLPILKQFFPCLLCICVWVWVCVFIVCLCVCKYVCKPSHILNLQAYWHKIHRVKLPWSVLGLCTDIQCQEDQHFPREEMTSLCPQAPFPLTRE